MRWLFLTTKPPALVFPRSFSEAARANAPSGPAWNSVATANHPDGAAVLFQDFPIALSVGNLVEGANVLAIQGLNVSTVSSDFLIFAELVAGEFEGPSPAPGATAYSGPFTLTQDTHVKARVEDGGRWSALNEAAYFLIP